MFHMFDLYRWYVAYIKELKWVTPEFDPYMRKDRVKGTQQRLMSHNVDSSKIFTHNY